MPARAGGFAVATQVKVEHGQSCLSEGFGDVGVPIAVLA